jgi:hypothetical protein
MKKGQLMGQPILYVFYAIVAILILIFGINQAIKLKDRGEDLTEVTFFKDINDKFNSVYSDSYGSVVSLSGLKIPNGMMEICFIDFSMVRDLSEINIAKLKDVIGNAFDSNANKDGYFVKRNDDWGSFEIERDFVLDKSVLCDSLIDGKLDIKLVNEGELIRAQHI